MKKTAAIAFSLLLIVAQTFAVAAPVGSGAPVAKRSCCGNDCRCCFGESGAPVAPPVESTTPAAAQNQFILPLDAVALFTLAAPATEVSSASVPAEFRPASAPIFTRNCSFLI